MHCKFSKQYMSKIATFRCWLVFGRSVVAVSTISVLPFSIVQQYTIRTFLNKQNSFTLNANNKIKVKHFILSFQVTSKRNFLVKPTNQRVVTAENQHKLVDSSYCCTYEQHTHIEWEVQKPIYLKWHTPIKQCPFRMICRWICRRSQEAIIAVPMNSFVS